MKLSIVGYREKKSHCDEDSREEKIAAAKKI